MKIIFLLPSPNISGASVIFEYVDRLASRGHNVLLASLDEIEEFKSDPFKTIPVHVNAILKEFETADAIISVGAVCAFYIDDLDIKVNKYSLLLNDEAKRYTKALYKFKYKKLDEHQIEIEQERQLNYLASSYNLPFKYLTVNNELTDLIKSYNDKVTTIPIGVNKEIFYPDIAFPKTDLVRILVVGDAIPGTGLTDVNAVLSDLREFDLWTVGNLKQSIKADKHWQAPDSEGVRKIVSSCDIIIKANYYDGIAQWQSYAMACGCAIITSSTSGSDMFCTSKNSLMFEAGDKKQLTRHLKKLMKDKQLRNSLIREGFKTAKTLDWEKSITELENQL